MKGGRSFIIFLILLCTLTVFEVAEQVSDNTVTIGALLSMTGGSSTHSLSVNAALDLAALPARFSGSLSLYLSYT